MSAEFLIKRWGVSVIGHPVVDILAASRGKATAEVWRRYSSAYDCTFKRFLTITRVARSTSPAPAHFGEHIHVSGSWAFFCGMSGPNFLFARPGEDRVFTSHPLDVMRPWEKLGGNGSVPF